MMDAIITATLWFSAIGAGLMAGVYFAFSTFITTSLARIPQAEGVSAMQSINTTILRSLFMPLFFGTTLAGIAMAVLALLNWGQSGSAAMFGGGVIYVFGMFLCTVVFNVPQNSALAAVDVASAEATHVWSRYLKVWTFWNHVRTTACVIASVMFIAAFATHRR